MTLCTGQTNTTYVAQPHDSMCGLSLQSLRTAHKPSMTLNPRCLDANDVRNGTQYVKVPGLNPETAAHTSCRWHAWQSSRCRKRGISNSRVRVLAPRDSACSRLASHISCKPDAKPDLHCHRHSIPSSPQRRFLEPFPRMWLPKAHEVCISAKKVTYVVAIVALCSRVARLFAG